jgi:hypothetical protein
VGFNTVCTAAALDACGLVMRAICAAAAVAAAVAQQSVSAAEEVSQVGDRLETGWSQVGDSTCRADPTWLFHTQHDCLPHMFHNSSWQRVPDHSDGLDYFTSLKVSEFHG